MAVESRFWRSPDLVAQLIPFLDLSSILALASGMGLRARPSPDAPRVSPAQPAHMPPPQFARRAPPPQQFSFLPADANADPQPVGFSFVNAKREREKPSPPRRTVKPNIAVRGAASCVTHDVAHEPARAARFGASLAAVLSPATVPAPAASPPPSGECLLSRAQKSLSPG